MNKFRILIADDNQLIRTLLVRLLEESGNLEVVERRPTVRSSRNDQGVAP